MLRWSRFKGECDKGQFFVISIVIIVISLTSMVSFFDVYDEIRLSDFHRYQEDGIFRSVTEGVEETVDSSECGIDDQPRKRNLLDFRKTVVEDASPRDVYINITYREFCGYYNQTVTAIDVKSPGFSMHHAFEAMPKEHEYELTVNIEGGGSVEVDGDKYDDEYTGTYTEGTDVELQAIPDTEWVFDEWTGDCFGEDPDDCEVTMNQDREVTAHFEEIEDPDEYTLTVDEPDGEGTVEVDGDEIGENEYPYTEDFTDGEEVNLYADPDDGWEFVEWTGDKESYDEEITITMDEDKEAKAYFEELE